MKVLPAPLAPAMIGVLLLALSPTLLYGREQTLSSPRHVRRAGDSSIDAVANGRSAPSVDEAEGDVEVAHGHGRGVSANCGEYTCGGDLHFCNATDFVHDWCEYSFYDNAVRSSYNRVCATADPTAIVLGHQSSCTGQIGSVKFDLFKDGVRIRRYAEKAWPYTVFGDTVTPLAAKSRVLAAGSYKMRVDVKDWNGCVMETQNYAFDVVDC